MTINYGCQQVLISPNSELKAVLEYVCSVANNLTNCGIYYSRQLDFKTGKFPSSADLHKQLATREQNKHYQALYSDTAQQILTTVAESFKSYDGEKPVGWKASGRRLTRGIYQSLSGIKINADCNGAANILRKVAAMFKLDLSGVSRGALSAPKKVLLWTLQKSSYLQVGEA